MTRDIRTGLRWFGAILFVAIVGIGNDVRRSSRPAELRQSLTPHIPASTLGRRVQAAVLLQKTDCFGNLRMLDLLYRRKVRDQLQLSIIWYAGPREDSTFLRAVLPAWTKSVPLRPVNSHILASLARLGHASTPTLIVLDQSARIRLVTQSPQSAREFAGLARVIEGLTWIEEL